MMIKTPSAEEVVGLASAATGPDETLDSPMQHLLIQLQERRVAQSPHPNTGAASNSSVAKCKKSAKLKREYPTSNVIELMPSSATITKTEPVALESATSSSIYEVGLPVSPSVRASTSTTITKRRSIPLSMKKEAIEWIMGPGKGIPSRAEKHFDWGVSASSFRKWWNNREKIMKDSGSKKRISGGGRKPYLDDSEERLLVVLIQERAKKDRVTRKWIAKTAQHMFRRSNTSFKASENWVGKFIRRNGLTLKRSCVAYEPLQASLER